MKKATVAVFAAAVLGLGIAGSANAEVIPSDQGIYANLGVQPILPINKAPDTAKLGVGKVIGLGSSFLLGGVEANYLINGTANRAAYVSGVIFYHVPTPQLFIGNDIEFVAKGGWGSAGKTVGVGVIVMPLSGSNGLRLDIDGFERLGGSFKTVGTISLIHRF